MDCAIPGHHRPLGLEHICKTVPAVGGLAFPCFVETKESGIRALYGERGKRTTGHFYQKPDGAMENEQHDRHFNAQYVRTKRNDHVRL